MHNAVRHVSHEVSQLDSIDSSSVARGCREVMSNASAPVRVRDGHGFCEITGTYADNCVELYKQVNNSSRTPSVTSEKWGARPEYTNSPDFLIHQRFSHFFLMLWYAHKIEHVMRNYTRCWIDAAGFDNVTISTICASFENQDELFLQMYTIFEHARKHISTSLALYMVSL